MQRSILIAKTYIGVASHNNIRIRILGKCSKTFQTLFSICSNNMLVIMDVIHKMLFKIENRKDPDQKKFDMRLLLQNSDAV